MTGNHRNVTYHQLIIIGAQSAPLLPYLKEALAGRFKKEGQPEDGFTIMNPHRKSFSNGEFLNHVSGSVRDADVYILAQPRNVEHLIHSDIFETLQLIRSSRFGQAYRVNLLMPSMPYARQDRATRDREFPSFRLFCDQLEAAGVDTVTTFEVHNDATVGYMDGKLSSYSTLSWMARKIERQLINQFDGRCHLIAPDTGSAKNIEKLRALLGTERYGGQDISYSIVQKDRDTKTNKTKIIGVSTPSGMDLAGTCCIMVDDMVDTGGTAAQAAELLYDKYGVREVVFVATHGIFSEGACAKLASGRFKKVCVTDSCPLPDEMQGLPGLTVWSVREMMAGLVYNIHNGKSNVEFVTRGGSDD